MYSATERIWKDATEGTLQELKDNRIRELLQKMPIRQFTIIFLII